jgi:4-aminobutyrate aminotransferase/(S)-3-amino-2-methylpropionate transaminase
MATNHELLERRQKAVPRGVSTAAPVFAERAENAEVWDVEGKRYIDFAGGIGVLNSGHRHPKVLAAVQRQSEKFFHTAFQVMAYESYVELAEKLNGLVPVGKPAKTILFTTGAEAVENAVKIAKGATGRSGVIAFVGGFHGRTCLSMALTGKVIPYKKGFGPFPSGIYHAPYPVPYHGVSEDDSFRALEKIFKADIDPSEVAAILIEPVQGEGGFYIASAAFLRRLRALCDAHGILLIADEVQSGVARTGKFFAIEHSGVRPDLITIAKSIGAGLPLSAVSGSAAIMDALDPGGLGGTYAGNPVACAAALAVLEVVAEENLLQKSTTLGQHLVRRITELAEKFPAIGEIRNLGGMAAFELVKDRTTHEPDADRAKKLTAAALEHGLILLSCGLYSNVIRILVPLTAPISQIDEGLGLLEKALTDVNG